MIFLIGLLIFIVSITVHEASHAFAAHRLGDDTAKQAGRLTLNPFKHIDPFWTVLLPAILFFSTQGRFAIGMAKPVPIDFSHLKKPKSDMIWVAFAGPLANIILAAFLAWSFHTWNSIYLLYGIYFNLGLAFFNLIPIPPLDGSRILAGMLPRSWVWRYLRIEKFGYLLILLFYFSGILMKGVGGGINFFCRWWDLPVF